MEISFLSIDVSHALYPEWFSLRQRLLRDPLGISFSEKEHQAEQEDHQLVALAGEQLLGGLLIRIAGLPLGSWKIRQVAVDPVFQGKGIGRRLMEEVIRRARVEGIEQLVLHSRKPVCGFYEALGFEVVGEPFEEVGIPHRKMILSLAFP